MSLSLSKSRSPKVKKLQSKQRSKGSISAHSGSQKASKQTKGKKKLVQYKNILQTSYQPDYHQRSVTLDKKFDNITRKENDSQGIIPYMREGDNLQYQSS
jgi:hypothetical protein